MAVQVHRAVDEVGVQHIGVQEGGYRGVARSSEWDIVDHEGNRIDAPLVVHADRRYGDRPADGSRGELRNARVCPRTVDNGQAPMHRDAFHKRKAKEKG